jgi:hypothetical protein
MERLKEGRMTGKVPVSRRALIQRYNRLIQHSGEKIAVRRRRGPEQYDHLDMLNGVLLRSFTDLEKAAREAGVLKPYEQVTR